jgi:hypothetical protein
MLAFDYGDAERAELMRRVWEGTPWMVDVLEGDFYHERGRDMLEWCDETFGPAAWPIHGRPGTWHRGSATVYGHTWYGFATEAQMRQFCERWGVPIEVAP